MLLCLLTDNFAATDMIG